MATIEFDSAKNPLVNNIFMLRVDALYDLACTKVSGITQELEYENIMEGGVNDYVQLRQKPSTKVKVLEIERYIGEKYLDPLTVGRRPVLPLILYVSRYMGDFTTPKMVFTFTGCTVMEKSYGELDAESSGLFKEKTKIAYETVIRLPNIIEEISSSWSFDETGKNFKGVGKRHAQYDKNEVRKIVLEQNARKWPEQRSARTIKSKGYIV
jgi:hypothetical protein